MARVSRRVRGVAPSPAFSRILGLCVVFFVMITICFLCWSFSTPALTVRQLSDQRILYQSPLRPGGQFSLIYVHSIHRTPVEERFYIDGQRKIVLDAVLFDSYGVGMPAELEGQETLRLQDGKILQENMNRLLDTFDLRTGQVIANHKLRIRGRTIPLSNIAAPGSAVRIEVTRLHPILYLKGVLRDGG